MKELWKTIPLVAFAAGANSFAAQYLSVADAQRVCFPEADRFESSDLDLSDEQAARISRICSQKVRARKVKVWIAKSGDKLLGYFVLDAVIGKHLLIDYAVALAPDGTVKQVEILEYRERYGGQVSQLEWRKQFAGKRSQAELKFDSAITNVTGATLSCRHVTEGVQKVLAIYAVCLR
jgi:Na+-translocating ferredoxin:NAD+ oxidoreductase RnfG subunit